MVSAVCARVRSAQVTDIAPAAPAVPRNCRLLSVAFFVPMLVPSVPSGSGRAQFGRARHACALGKRSRSAVPAGLRHVDHDAVGACVFHLDIALLTRAAAHAQRSIDVIARMRAGSGKLRMDLVEVLHLKSDVMEAEPVLATCGSRHRIVLAAETREIEVTIAEIVAARAVGIELAAPLHVADGGE